MSSLALYSTFVALDFETANRDRNSACALALVRVEQGHIVHRVYQLIRPPTAWFEYSHIHGIHWNMVQNQPTFSEIWPALAQHFEDIECVVAHNASFDRNVLQACCALAQVQAPSIPFECTLRLARKFWKLQPASLDQVAKFLGLPLIHHHAGSDAEICAKIMIAIQHETHSG